MKELKALNEQDFSFLKHSLEKSTGLLFPDDATRFGDLKFHIYSGASDKEFHFQLFWGPHKLYAKKHLKERSPDDLFKDLANSIKKDGKKIARAAIQYCEERLADFLQIELQPVLLANGLNALEIEIKVRQSKKVRAGAANGGWPVFCLLMSWTDEFGEFQEFVHKITFNKENKLFNIDPQIIVKKFINYRNSLI